MASDSSTIDIVIPANYDRRIVELLAIIENFKVNSDESAKIVINERTGTIVAGGEVQLKTVAISHGDLVIEIKDGGSSGGAAKGKGNRVAVVDQNTSLNDLVKALNALGTTPEDLMSIFQALKKSGSLIGDLEFI